jgi:hypothetical protein
MEVALALADRGHEAVLWNGSDFPTRQSASIDIQGGQVAWEISGPGLDGGRPPFDVVWFRRPTPAVLPAEIHPGDLPVAQRECRHLLRGLYQLVGPKAFWVNPLASDPRAALKPPQLEAAVRTGLTVPRTLISNDPEQIQRFLTELRGRTVYKPFHASQWEDEGLMAVLLTNEVTVDDLPRDETLRLTPGIFQEKIDKAHELRVTVMGAHVVTARILSQESEETRLDWRMPGAETRIEPDRLPREVERACRRLMKDLGIVFGCFDFIVTPEESTSSWRSIPRASFCGSRKPSRRSGCLPRSSIFYSPGSGIFVGDRRRMGRATRTTTPRHAHASWPRARSMSNQTTASMSAPIGRTAA